MMMKQTLNQGHRGHRKRGGRGGRESSPPTGIEQRTKRDNLLLLNKSKQRFLFLVFGFTAVYNQERVILQTIYLLNKEILQIRGL